METSNSGLSGRRTNSLAKFLNPLSLARNVTDGVRLVAANYKLILAMVVRELKSRYAGQFTGSFWIVGHPLFQLLTFVFIFGVVFQQRIGGSLELPRDYTTYMLAGLVPWLSLTPLLASSCNSVIGNANLVKQFTFKTELLPVKDVAIAMIFWVVGFAILATHEMISTHSLPWTYLLVPFLLAMHLMFATGIAWFLSSISVFVRDMKDVITIVVTAGIYVLPIVYLPQWVPGIFRPFVALNPLSAMIWAYQDTFYYGRIEHPFAWLIFAAMSVLTFGFGFRTFGRLKMEFGRVL